MAESLSLPNIPTSKMFLDDPEGRTLTVEWQEFFRGLWARVGGLQASTLIEIENLIASQTYEIRVKILNEKIDEIERLIEAQPTPKVYEKEIQELKTLIHSLPTPKSYDKEVTDLEDSDDFLQAMLTSDPPQQENNAVVVLDTPKSYDNDIAKLAALIEAQPATHDHQNDVDELQKILYGFEHYVYKFDVPICMDYFDAVPARGSESNWHGGLLSLATGQPLDSVPTNLVVTKGIGKLIIVVNAGSDISGSITITGESIDRNTGASTPADTDVIAIDALTTDGTTTDSNGNTVHSFTGAYISSKWFTGTVTLSTADLTLTDVDVYHISFEQVNDSRELKMRTFDANIFTTNVAAEFDAYLYTLHVISGKCNINKEADLHVGADGETAIENKYWRLRRGNIDEFIDGTTDGFWVDVHYANSPVYVEDVTVSVWLTQTIVIG